MEANRLLGQAQRDAVHRASVATHPRNRFAPPEAGLFHPVASLRFFADAPHRHAKRAYPRGGLISVK